MPERIHIVVELEEKQRFRRMAIREGKTLSQWLRDAAYDRMAALEERTKLDTSEALESFFEQCDRREAGTEPDWDVHRRAIEESLASGRSST